MNETLILRLVDSSSKECEVTGDLMGGDDVYEIPVSKLKPGWLEWPQKRLPDHSITIVSIGDGFVELTIRDVSGSVNGPYTLHVGEEKHSRYEFGEWGYGYTVSLISK